MSNEQSEANTNTTTVQTASRWVQARVTNEYNASGTARVGITTGARVLQREYITERYIRDNTKTRMPYMGETKPP